MDSIIFAGLSGAFLLSFFLLWPKKERTIFHSLLMAAMVLAGLIWWYIGRYDREIGRYILVTFFSLIVTLYTSLLFPICTNRKSTINRVLGRILLLINSYGIWIVALFFLCVFSYITIARHLHFQTTGFDLGLFDQAVYQYSQGIFPAGSSIRGVLNIESDHFNPILILFAGAYWIYSSPLTLLMLQNLFFILGALGIYQIAVYRLQNKRIALGLFILSCVFLGNINALLFDFHPLVPAVSMLPWLVYFAMRRYWKLFALLLIPILTSKENMSLYIVFLGIYMFFFLKAKKAGILTLLVGAGYFWISMQYLLPLMGSEAGAAGRYWSYDSLGANPRDLILNVFQHPLDAVQVLFSDRAKLLTYLHHLGSGGFIGFFNPAIILLIPSYAQKFLSSRPEFWTMNFHYSIDIFWVIAVGIISTFAFLKQRLRQRSQRIVTALFVGIFINSILINLYPSPLLHRVRKWENEGALREVIASLPSQVSISTQNQIAPHFSHNPRVYVFPDIVDADYILLNTKIDELWPVQDQKTFDDYVTLLRSGASLPPVKLPFKKFPSRQELTYSIVVEKEGIILLEKIDTTAPARETVPSEKI